jgi:hypothetical protein
MSIISHLVDLTKEELLGAKAWIEAEIAKLEGVAPIPAPAPSAPIEPAPENAAPETPATV